MKFTQRSHEPRFSVPPALKTTPMTDFCVQINRKIGGHAVRRNGPKRDLAGAKNAFRMRELCLTSRTLLSKNANTLDMYLFIYVYWKLLKTFDRTPWRTDMTKYERNTQKLHTAQQTKQLNKDVVQPGVTRTRRRYGQQPQEACSNRRSYWLAVDYTYLAIHWYAVAFRRRPQ